MNMRSKVLRVFIFAKQTCPSIYRPFINFSAHLWSHGHFAPKKIQIIAHCALQNHSTINILLRKIKRYSFRAKKKKSHKFKYFVNFYNHYDHFQGEHYFLGQSVKHINEPSMTATSYLSQGPSREDLSPSLALTVSSSLVEGPLTDRKREVTTVSWPLESRSRDQIRVELSLRKYMGSSKLSID